MADKGLMIGGCWKSVGIPAGHINPQCIVSYPRCFASVATLAKQYNFLVKSTNHAIVNNLYSWLEAMCLSSLKDSLSQDCEAV